MRSFIPTDRRTVAMARTFLWLGLAIVAVSVLAGRPALGGGLDEAQDVTSRTGNPSPTAAASDVDRYTFQDEQINIDGGKDSTVKVLRVNQKNLVNDFVVAVYPIERASPREMRSLFRIVTGKEGGRAEIINDKVAGKAFLQVICPEFQLPYIEAAIKALDEPWLNEEIDGSKQFYYRARFRNVANLNTVASVPGGGDGDTTVVDTTSNAVFKRMEPYRAQQWLTAAEAADFFPPQLVLDASVYEVELTNDLKLGLDYVAWKCGPGRDLFDFVFWGLGSRQRAEDVTSEFDPFVPARTLIVGTDTLKAHGRGFYAATNFLLTAEYMDFLVRKGRARLVTTGRLNVRHGTLGTLSVTDEVLHFVVTPGEDDLLDAHGNVEEDFEELLGARCLEHGDVTVGFTLSVTPYIGLETTELVYSLTASDIAGTTPAGTPIVRNNTVLGTVLLRDGTPICIGGLKRTEDVKSTAKIPVLGSIPVLGYLFGGEQDAKHQTELVVVLNPQVVQYSEIHKELAREEDRLVRAQILEAARLPMLDTVYGFDQWLLGKD